MFNVEEMNLMCIFNTGSRTALIADIQESLPDVYDPELREIMQTVAGKLELLTDDIFLEIVFSPDYDDGQEDE